MRTPACPPDGRAPADHAPAPAAGPPHGHAVRDRSSTRMNTPRWFTEFGDDHAEWYINRFRRLAERGADLAGEARFVDALVAPGSRILDAGCGAGRVGGELHRRGHEVVGVDVDAALIDAARLDHPGPPWHVADLLDLDRLDLAPPDARFDAAVLAGNVLVYVAPGTEAAVLGQVAAKVRNDGAVVTGFAVDRHYSLDAFDADCAQVGLRVESRFATWDLRPWRDGDDFAVTVLRVG